MFSDGTNQPETYTYIRTKLIILEKYKSLSGPIHLEIFLYARERKRERERGESFYCI